MPAFDIDLTLDSLKIPNINGTFPFGTKITPTTENKGGLSTAEVNSNIMLPFTQMRPKVCSSNSTTSQVEYDAKVVFNAPTGVTPSAGYTLTMGDGTYIGCTVTFTNLMEYACTVMQSDGTTTLFSVPAGKTLSAMWNGTAWLWTTTGSVTANDPTPVSSAAVHAAVDGKTYFVKGEIVSGTNTPIRGHGTAEVILQNGKASINFVAKITTAGTENNIWSWGLSATKLKALNNALPTISPLSEVSGTGVYYNSSGNIDIDATSYGGCFTGNSPYWTPTRLYDTSGNLGGWPPVRFPVDKIITGTVFGTY